jgi:hypothetical protein
MEPSGPVQACNGIALPFTELLNWWTRKEVCAVIQILWAQNSEHLIVHRRIVAAYVQIKHVCHWHRWNGAGRQISIMEAVKSWHLTSHTAVLEKLFMNTWAATKRSPDVCQNICPTDRSLTEWPSHWPHSTVKELKMMIYHQWWDIGASLQPGDENGIHGIEAFHITCKEGV